MDRVIAILIAGAFIAMAMYGCVGYGIHLGYQKCKRPSMAVTLTLMFAGLFGLGFVLVYLLFD